MDSSDAQGNKLWRKEYWKYYDEESDTFLSNIHDRYIYTYDDIGTLIKEINEDYDPVSLGNPKLKTILSRKTMITYDVEYRDGRLYRYGRSPEYTETWFKSFGGNEADIGKEQHHKTKWPQFSLYFYDAEGNKIREEIEGMPNYWEFYPNGIIKKSFYGEGNYSENNEDGYVVKLLVDRPRPTNVYKAKYDQLDEHGNWTRVIVYKNGVPNEYGERRIIYYDN